MKENKILKWSLILSAVIVANLFFNYSLSLIFNGPEYSDFCDRDYSYAKQLSDKEMEEEQKYFNECNDNFQKASEEFEKKVFLSLISIGVVLLIASAFTKNSVVTSALALTAFLDFIISTFRYWRYSDELLKVGILFIALIVIFYLIVKKFKDSN